MKAPLLFVAMKPTVATIPFTSVTYVPCQLCEMLQFKTADKALKEGSGKTELLPRRQNICSKS